MEKNSAIDFNNVSISMDETYHIHKNEPLYNSRFQNVMGFHDPGVAAVQDKVGAFHIDLEGIPIYEKRFQKAFGFYEGCAAVSDSSGWYHINIEGESVYKARYDWVGNFQEGRCPVRDNLGNYFHINLDGKTAYNERFRYVGDYKYGIAAVYMKNGLARHIDKQGNYIHDKKYNELGIFHKGYAIARDRYGYFHINKEGFPFYENRYQWAEPFYNGAAFVLKFNGEKVIINENGKEIHKIYDQSNQIVKNLLRKRLKDMLVGYWKTQILYAITRLEFFDSIDKGYTEFEAIRNLLNIPKESLEMIIKVLKLWQFIIEENNQYNLTYLGKMLTENHPERLKYAALMWGDDHYTVMSRLYEALKAYKPQFKNIFGKDFFSYILNHKDKSKIYNNALAEYTLDYDSLLELLDLSDIDTIMDVGGGRGFLLNKILQKNNNIKKGIIFDLPFVIEEIKENVLSELLDKRIELGSGDFFEKIPGKADAIILSRILHDWNDKKSIKILNNLKEAIKSDGKLFIFEMIVPEEIQYDYGTTLNFNLLVTVGGKERSLKEFTDILNNSGFYIDELIQSDGIMSIIIAKLK